MSKRDWKFLFEDILECTVKIDEYLDELDYTDFVKIVWTGPGSPLWGQYTIVQEVLNDKTGGFSGLLEKVGTPGFGLNDHWTMLP